MKRKNQFGCVPFKINAATTHTFFFKIKKNYIWAFVFCKFVDASN